jgi:hypothetical protein
MGGVSWEVGELDRGGRDWGSERWRRGAGETGDGVYWGLLEGCGVSGRGGGLRRCGGVGRGRRPPSAVDWRWRG